MRKKVFWMVVLIIFIFSLLFVIFLLTFNVNHLKPYLIQQIESTSGKRVELQTIALGWRGGIALKAEGLSIYPDREGRGEPLLVLDSVNAVLELGPLFARKLRVGSLILEKPRIHVVNSQKPVLPQPVGPISSTRVSSSKGAQTSSASGILSFLIQKIEVNNGEFQFRDESQSIPFELTIQNIDFDLKNITMGQSIPLKGKASFFSRKQNINVQGSVAISTKTQEISLEQLHIEGDLNAMDHKDLIRAFPGLEQAGFPETIPGNFSVGLNKPISLSHANFDQIDFSIAVDVANFKAARMPTAIKDISFQGKIQGGSLVINACSAKWGGGDLSASGVVNELSKVAKANVRVSASGIDVVQVVPQGGAGEPYLTGKMFAAFEGSFVGTRWPQISKNLSGKGKMKIQDGVIRDFNLIREIFERLSIIPKVVEKLQEGLPPAYEEKLKARDTVLGPVEIPYFVSSGDVRAPQIVIQSNSFVLSGAGAFNFSGGLTAQMMIYLDPELSSAMSGSINELRYLQDANGQLAIPFNISGVLLHLKMLPDFGYITSRLAVGKTTELVDSLVQKKMALKEGAAETPPDDATGAPNDSPLATLLGGLLNAASQNSENSDTAASRT